MPSPELTIRSMSSGEIELALDWAAAEGWNPGLFDAAPFHAADPGGFLIGYVGDEPVAVVSAVRYGAGFGFIGFYLVKPDRRGQGYGWAIWQAAMARLAGRSIGLDGVRITIAAAGFAWRTAMCVTRASAPLGQAMPPCLMACVWFRCRRCPMARWRATTHRSFRPDAAHSCAAGSRSRRPWRLACCAATG
ncbi:MAG: GNAT family N-acetyltransferase [Rhodocyclaceae bacterium]